MKNSPCNIPRKNVKIAHFYQKTNQIEKIMHENDRYFVKI